MINVKKILKRDILKYIKKKTHHFCSVDCKNIAMNKNGVLGKKLKISFKEKYGTDYPLMNDSIKNKAKKTLMKKYGVDNVFKLKKVRQKAVKMSMTKESIRKRVASRRNKIPQMVAKMKKTNLIRYGCECSLQNKEVAKKAKHSEAVIPQKDRRIKVGLKYGNLTKSEMNDVIDPFGIFLQFKEFI